MKDRIQQIMIHEGMNQQEFSRATGIAPASLSSIFTGRTSPTLKHAEALHQHFPNLNMSWLLFGDGEMMNSQDESDGNQVSQGQPTSASPDSSPSSSSPILGSAQGSAVSSSHDPLSGRIFQSAPLPAPPSSAEAAAAGMYAHQISYEYLKNIDIKPRRIAEIRIFFDDGTFEVFKGNI